jgi:hypothetical protein
MLNPSARNMSKTVFSVRRNTDEKKERGVTATELKGQLGKELFEEGLANGDIIENPETKLYYMRSHERRLENTAVHDKNAMIEYQCDNTADWMAGVAAMMNRSSDWLPDREVSPGAASSASDIIVSDLADEALYAKLQSCYDRSEQLRSNVSKCGQELMRVTTLTDEGVEMVRVGITLSKKVVEAKCVCQHVRVSVLLFTKS